MELFSPKFKMNYWWIVLIVVIIILILILVWWWSTSTNPLIPLQPTEDQYKQLMEFVRLLDKRSFLTREYMIAIAARQGGLCTGQVADRLSNAETDFGNLFSRFTDSGAGEQLTELMQQQDKRIENVVVLMKNAQDYTADLQAAKDIDQKIVDLIASKVPQIDKVALQTHMQQWLDKTIEEAKAIVNNQCMNSLITFEVDILPNVALVMEDLMKGLLLHFHSH